MKLDSKLISVIIPCYNAEKYIAETINSVLNQTYQNIEIIVIDDESKDGSSEIVKQLARCDERITYRFQQNRGMCATRNAGLEIASGDYVLFLDNDDVIESTFLEDRIFFLESHPEYGLCGSAIQKINGSGDPLRSEYFQHAPTEEMLNEILLYDRSVVSIPSNLLIRHQVLKDFGVRFNERLSSTGDKFFLVQLATISRAANIKAAPINYRVHNDSMSSKLTKALFKDNELYVNLLLEHRLIPDDIKKECLGKNYYILAVMSAKLGNFADAAKYMIKLLGVSPSTIVRKINKFTYDQSK